VLDCVAVYAVALIHWGSRSVHWSVVCGTAVRTPHRTEYVTLEVRTVLASSCLSIQPHGRAWLQLNGFSWNLIHEDFSKIVVKIQVLWKYDKNITGTLHEDLCAFMTICRRIILRMRNVSYESCRENQNAHFMFSNFFFYPENRAVYEIMWKTMVGPHRLQMTI
jgi:hypothetical protein